jgi:superfamily I DNA/RNA helicase
MPHELGVFVRSAAELDRARAAVKDAGIPSNILDEKVETISGQVSISTMHLAKGLEFRAVVVMACDDEVIPLQERIETVADDADLDEVYNTERHLLYVASTRSLKGISQQILTESGYFADPFLAPSHSKVCSARRSGSSSPAGFDRNP